MSARYIFRVDDVCPTMNLSAFMELERLFEEFRVKPIIGIIPDNQDEKLKKFPEYQNFWPHMERLVKNRWIVAQHGYQHRYISKNGGILDINRRSEFAGLPFEEQYEKIRSGKEILESRLSIKIHWWMAPAHSFDTETCRALSNLGFTHITDGMGIFPFKQNGLAWLPQQLWKPKGKLFGLWTICLHPDTITRKQFQTLRHFLKKNAIYCQSMPDDLQPSSSKTINAINKLYQIWWKLRYIPYRAIRDRIRRH